MASKEERYKDYENLLREISALKVKASIFHERLVKKARRVFDKKDVEKIDNFIINNKEAFLKAARL